MKGVLTIANEPFRAWPRSPERIQGIVEATSGPLYRFLHGMVGNAHEAEDLLQETYLAAQSSAEGYQGDSGLLTWLTGIALNLARHRLRRRQYERRFRRLASFFTRGAEPPDSAALRREEAERVRRAVAGLPDRERAVITMFDWEGLAHREIAAVLGCPEGTVWALLSRARAEVRRRLDHEL